MTEQLRHLLFRPTDIAPLVYFRVVFGAIMFWEVTRYLAYDWVERYYIDPDFFFTYFGFGWISPLGGNLMYVHFLVLGLLSVFIIIGLWYRLSAILFFFGFTYVFLLDQANYLNHFYLVCWVAFLMIFVPAHRSVSLDAIRKPEIRVATVPVWPQLLLCAIVGIAYFFGGVAKINADWLAGEPMRMWLARRTDTPLMGQFFLESWAPYFFSYGGLLLDLLVIPALIWRKTRAPAVILAASFHVMNYMLFSIGIFPWFMLFSTPLFFDPRRLQFVNRLDDLFGTRHPTIKAYEVSDRERRLVPIAVVVFAAYHVFMPLRHWLYPGNVNWTEEGHTFAWHMKLRNKTGVLRFVVTDKDTGESVVVNQADFLSSRQRRKMRSRPDMIVHFAHHLETIYRDRGHRDVMIFADSQMSLNGRPRHRMIDNNVDLTEIERSVWPPADWILPLPDESDEMSD